VSEAPTPGQPPSPPRARARADGDRSLVGTRRGDRRGSKTSPHAEGDWTVRIPWSWMVCRASVSATLWVVSTTAPRGVVSSRGGQRPRPAFGGVAGPVGRLQL
jgi:hypothetical protein